MPTVLVTGANRGLGLEFARRYRADGWDVVAGCRKPDEAYSRIEALCEGPYLELFARGQRPGWDSWGTEAGSGAAGLRRWRADGFPDAPEAVD